MFIVIVGCGGAGGYLAGRLSSTGHKVAVIDINPDELSALSRSIPDATAVLGDGTRLEVLRRAGLEKADVLAVLTGADEKNLSIAMLAKNEFRVPRVIARVNDPNHEWIFDRSVGVDYAFNQDALLVDAVIKALQAS